MVDIVTEMTSTYIVDHARVHRCISPESRERHAHVVKSCVSATGRQARQPASLAGRQRQTETQIARSHSDRRSFIRGAAVRRCLAHAARTPAPAPGRPTSVAPGRASEPPSRQFVAGAAPSRRQRRALRSFEKKAPTGLGVERSRLSGGARARAVGGVAGSPLAGADPRSSPPGPRAVRYEHLMRRTWTAARRSHRAGCGTRRAMF